MTTPGRPRPTQEQVLADKSAQWAAIRSDPSAWKTPAEQQPAKKTA